MSQQTENFLCWCFFAFVIYGAYWIFRGPEFSDLIMCAAKNPMPWEAVRCELLAHKYLPK